MVERSLNRALAQSHPFLLGNTSSARDMLRNVSMPFQKPGGFNLWLTLVHLGNLCTPFRYPLTFLSNMLYLSLGSISASVGISAFHLSINFVVPVSLTTSLNSTFPGVGTPTGFDEGTQSPCLGPLPCRSSDIALLFGDDFARSRCPSAVVASSSLVAVPIESARSGVSLAETVSLVSSGVCESDAVCFRSALSRIATTLSTRRSRCRWRCF